MKEKLRRHRSPHDKVVVIRRHLVEGVPVSDLCDEYGIHPTLFYKWQKQFFEKGEQVFEPEREGRVRKLERQIDGLNDKIRTKDEIIAELLGEHMALKKSVGAI